MMGMMGISHCVRNDQGLGLTTEVSNSPRLQRGLLRNALEAQGSSISSSNIIKQPTIQSSFSNTLVSNEGDDDAMMGQIVKKADKNPSCL